MVTLTIDDIPDDLYEQLRRRAKMKRRSTNNEAIVCIEKAVRSHRMPPDVALMPARRLRKKIRENPLQSVQIRVPLKSH